MLPPVFELVAATVHRTVAFLFSNLPDEKEGDGFCHLLHFGFGGNYGYNSRQQFGECTPHVNSVPPPGVLLYPSTNFCTPSDKSVPQEVPGIPELSVR